LAETGDERSVVVRLRGAGDAGAGADDWEGVPLPSSHLAKSASRRFFHKYVTGKGKALGVGPTVSARVGSVPPSHAALAKSCPREILLVAPLAPVVAAFREACEDEVDAVGRAFHARRCRVALTVVPECLRDDVTARALAETWRRAMPPPPGTRSDRGRGACEPARSERRSRSETLESVALKFWALTRCEAYTGGKKASEEDSWCAPSRRRRRFAALEAFANSHPRELLSRDSSGWLHAPLDVAELAHAFET
jgi:hypothetical protein